MAKYKLSALFGLLAAFSALAALAPVSLPAGRVNIATAQGTELLLDADVSNGGPCATIDSQITVKPGQPFQVAVCLKGLTGPVTAFQLDLIYDDTIINAPEVALEGEGVALDDNPDVNAGSTTWGDSLGEGWSCNILDMGQQPVGDNDPETGPGHGLAQIACWTLGYVTTLGDNEDSGVLAVISFNGAPSSSDTTTIEVANVVLGTSSAQELGSCNPTVGIELACRGATIQVSGDTIPADQWPTATPASGETKRAYSPSGALQVTSEPIPDAPELTPTTAQPTKNATVSPTKTEAAKATPAAEEDGENGDNGWLLPVVIAAAAVVAIGGASLAFYLRRRR